MGIFSRKPKLRDAALGELAVMFASPDRAADDPTPGADLLTPSRLDFTLDSLAFVDEYLEQLRARKLDAHDYGKLVLRCGAYVGEVVARNARARTYHWLSFEDAVRINRNIGHLGDGLGTTAVLWDGAGGMTFPLAKVMKFLENGPEDSVRFFAMIMLDPPG